MSLINLELGKVMSNLRTNNQRGAAIAEAAIVLPLLIFLALGTFDLSRIFHQYMVLSFLAGEGSRVLSEWSNLEDLASPSAEMRLSTNTTFCAQSGVEGASDDCRLQHLQAEQVISRLIDLHKLQLSNLDVYTGYSAIGSSGSQQTVKVRLVGQYTGLLPFMKGIEISAEKRAQYLN